MLPIVFQLLEYKNEIFNWKMKCKIVKPPHATPKFDYLLGGLLSFFKGMIDIIIVVII